MKPILSAAHGGDIMTYKNERGDIEFIDFSANINPLGQPESVRLAINSSADECVSYPDRYCRKLKEAIAAYENVPQSWIVCGNGAADIIYRIALGFSPKEALVLAPTFAEYERALGFSGAQVSHHKLLEEDGFMLKNDFIERIRDFDMVFLCNPNNPTGILLDKNLLKLIAKECEKNDTILVVDECFMPFVSDGEERSLKASLEQNHNIILLKAFTKMFAVPGIRLGYALSADERTQMLLEGAAPPWNVSVPAQLCGIAAAGEREYPAKTRKLVETQRNRLKQELTSLGIKVYDGAANYLMIKCGQDDLVNKMAEKGIIIRECASFTGLGDGFYRIAVRLKHENDKLLEAFSDIIR